MTWRHYQRLQRLAHLGDTFLSYVDEGEGPPVVLLHGVPTWGWLWHDLVERLAPRFRVLVPDLVGYGFSDKRDRLDRSLPAQTAAIAAWLERLDVSDATVIGHDLGGAVALRLALLQPARVERLGLVAPACYDSWPAEAYLQLGHPEARRLPLPWFLRAVRMALRRGFETTPDRALLDGLAAPYTTETGQRSLVRNCAALDTNQTMLLVPHLGQVRQPTFVLWGEKDAYQSPRYAELLALDLPRAHVEEAPGAGHFVMLDAPELVVARLGELLRSPVGLDIDLRLPPFLT